MIYALNNTSSNINFTSNLRCVYNRSTNALKYMNTTKLFRQDLDWDGFAELLISKYKDVDKVNIYSYACSDGSEPYSLVIKLLEKSEKLKINCDKFFPIRAKDIDKKITLHTLRHTFGSTLLRRGIGIEVVSKLLGHANVKITYLKYIHTVQEEEAKGF